RRTVWAGALRWGDLVVGHGAMAYMLAPSRFRSSPLTVILVAYFLLLGLAAAAVVLGRSVTLELPGEAPASFARSVSTSSALAHTSMAVAMVFMLARI
ncbi:MAG TPA: hypothetical protein VJ456_11095, partial [Acidimicrobiia bacterium]|nr:hypothetical protein [Acidimicrobiia bacterium]